MFKEEEKMERLSNILTKTNDIFALLKMTKIDDSSSSAVEKMKTVIQYINMFAYIAGAELTTHWRCLNNRSIFASFVIVVLTWSCVYTFVVQFPSLKCLEIVGGSALMITGTVKFATAICKHENLLCFNAFIFKVYNERLSGNKEMILIDNTKIIKRHCRYVFGGIVFGWSVYACYPVYDFCFNGNLILVSPIVLPFVDETTLKGYLILTISNIFAASFALFASYAFSCAFLTYVDFYDGLVSLVEDDLDTFDGMWKRDDPSTVVKRHHMFTNVMTELMDLARFNSLMKELFETSATVQIISCYYGIVTLLLAYLANDYIGGIGAAAFFTTELLMFCFIGQLMENSNERISEVIYNANWYVYGTKYQKDLACALLISQNVSSIRVAGLYPLNFETGLQVVNNIYKR